MGYFKFFLFTQMVRFKKFWKFTILYPLHNTDILWVETNLFKGGKDDVHYVPDQSYQRFKQLWIPDQ